MGEDKLVFGDDGLTWRAFGDAIGADEPARLSRRHARLTTDTPIEKE